MRESTDLSGADLAALAGPVARALLGDPNPRLSRGANLRFGRKGSISVDAGAGLWKDFETGAGGGVLDLVMHVGVADSRRAAMAWLKRFDGREAPASAQRSKPTSPPPARTDTRDFARRIWRETTPIVGTAAERYLHARGVGHVAGAPALRFHHALRHPHAPGRYPCLVAGIQDVRGAFVGIQRTYLNGARKAEVEPERLSLGAVSGGAVHLADVDDVGGELLVGEGVETTGAAVQVLDWHGAAWATLGTAGLRGVEIPDGVCHVTIAADRDPGGGGQLAAAVLAGRLADEGRSVAIELPPFVGDWRDVLALSRSAA